MIFFKLASKLISTKLVIFSYINHNNCLLNSKTSMKTQQTWIKCEASLQCLLHKLKHKNFFNENEYEKLYPSGSVPALIYGRAVRSLPKCIRKNRTHMKKVGHTSEFLFGIYWWSWKTNNYWKNCWSGPIKNKIISIFTMLHF